MPLLLDLLMLTVFIDPLPCDLINNPIPLSPPSFCSLDLYVSFFYWLLLPSSLHMRDFFPNPQAYQNSQVLKPLIPNGTAFAYTYAHLSL